jgi:hypothetical protein
MPKAKGPRPKKTQEIDATKVLTQIAASPRRPIKCSLSYIMNGDLAVAVEKTWADRRALDIAGVRPRRRALEPD